MSEQSTPQQRIRKWCKLNGTYLNNKLNVYQFSGQINQFTSICFDYLFVRKQQLLAIKMTNISTCQPIALLYRLLIFFSTRNGQPLSFHLNTLMKENFANQIYWHKSVLYIHINVLLSGFLAYCHTYTASGKENELAIPKKYINLIEFFVKKYKITCHDVAFNSVGDGNILYVTDYPKQADKVIKDTFNAYAEVESITKIKYEYKPQLQLLIKFKNAKNLKTAKTIFKTDVFYVNQVISCKNLWVSDEYVEELQNKFNKPLNRIVIAVTNQQIYYDNIIGLDGYKTSMTLNKRSYYFKSLMSLIKDADSHNTTLGMVLLRRDIKELNETGKLTLIPTDIMDKISSIIFTNLSQNIQYKYEQYPYFTSSQYQQMQKDAENQIQNAAINLIGGLNKYYKSIGGTKSNRYFDDLSNVLEKLSQSKNSNDVLLCMKLIYVIDDKDWAEKYYKFVLKSLADSSYTVNCMALITIESLTRKFKSPIDKNVMPILLHNLKYKKLNAEKWLEIGNLIYKFAQSKREWFTAAINTFAGLFVSVVTQKDLKLAHGIFVEIYFALNIYKYNSETIINLNLDLKRIVNIIGQLFIYDQSINEDDNTKIFDIGLLLLPKIFKLCTNDEFINWQHTKSFGVVSAMLRNNCLEWMSANLFKNYNLIGYIVNEILNSTNNSYICKGLNLLEGICVKIKCCKPQIFAAEAVSILIRLTNKILSKWQQSKSVTIQCMDMLRTFAFLDNNNDILCNDAQFDELIKLLHNILAKENDIDILSDCLQCIAMVLFICEHKYIDTQFVFQYCRQMYNKKPLLKERIVEVMSYLISAIPSSVINEIDTITIATKLLADIDKTSEVYLSLMYNCALKVSFDKFCPLLPSFMSALLRPLIDLYDANCSDCTPALYANELNTTKTILHYLYSFLERYDKNLCKYSDEIIHIMKNILNKNYFYRITKDIRLATFDILYFFLTNDSCDLKQLNLIIHICIETLQSIEKNHYDEYDIVCKLLQSVNETDINNGKKQEIEEVIKTTGEQFTNESKMDEDHDTCNDIKGKKSSYTYPLFAIQEQQEFEESDDENDLNMGTQWNSGYNYNNGPILYIYEKIQIAKRRKSLSPLQDKLR